MNMFTAPGNAAPVHPAATQAASHMAVECGGRAWLIDLSEIVEVTAIQHVTRVPHVREWFVGIVSVRGRLWSVIDLALLGSPASVSPLPPRRIMLMQPRLLPHCALCVESMLGLRNIKDWPKLPPPPQSPEWIIGLRQAEDGRLWHQLSIQHLVRSPILQDVALPLP